MTPEERARLVLRAGSMYGLADEKKYVPLRDAIAQALRDHGNEKLEEWAATLELLRGDMDNNPTECSLPAGIVAKLDGIVTDVFDIMILTARGMKDDPPQDEQKGES